MQDSWPAGRGQWRTVVLKSAAAIGPSGFAEHVETCNSKRVTLGLGDG